MKPSSSAFGKIIKSIQDKFNPADLNHIALSMKHSVLNKSGAGFAILILLLKKRKKKKNHLTFFKQFVFVINLFYPFELPSREKIRKFLQKLCKIQYAKK